ncbi:MAG: TolC family protein, partial [Longimicrobiales bacterium]|nr:TolC family protein [Longimicrobiales bacterium]
MRVGTAARRLLSARTVMTHEAARRSILATALVAGWLMAVAPAPGMGQEPAPLRLTLDEALSFAEGSNPELRRAANATSLNPVESRQVWFDQILPSASLTLFNTSFTGNLQRRAIDNFGNPIENPAAEWNYYSRTIHNLSLDWSIQGPSLFQEYSRQQLVNRARELDRLVALNDVQIQVQRLYMDALEQRELLQAEEELIEARQVNLDAVQRLFELALRTRVDILQAELELEQQRLARQRQQSAYQQALLALRAEMGLDEDRPVELVDEELPVFDPAGLNADVLISRARAVNPSLQRTDAAIRADEVALSRERSDWWPQISFGVDLYRRAQASYSEALFDPPGTSELESQFFVGFSIPILNNYFQHQVDRQQARVALQNSLEADRQAKLETEEAIRGALLDLEGQWASVQVAERSLAIAREALRLAQEE